uniref:RING-type domain-containing protein n=1 Tax=viral metagenome TaxID=1070528 RepID=A0A6C0H5E6_9ZZZZ
MFKDIEEIDKKYCLKLRYLNYNENMVLSVFNSSEIKEEDYDLTDSYVLVIIGLYYLCVKKDNENAKKYYLIAIEKGNERAMNNLGYLYYDLKDYENAKKYWLMGMEKGDVIAINNLGVFCRIQNDNENAKKYYLMASEKGNDYGMYNLGKFLYEIEMDNENAKKYLLMAIEKGNNCAMNYIGSIYYDEKNYMNAEKYYLMAMEKGSIIAMTNLGILYEMKNDKNNAKMYYLMAIEKGCVNAMNNIKRIMNELKLYYCLKKMENKNELIENEIKELKKVKKVNEYEDMLIYFGELNNIKDCEICFKNDKLHLLMGCGRHEICKDCFIKVEKCPYCSY